MCAAAVPTPPRTSSRITILSVTGHSVYEDEMVSSDIVYDRSEGFALTGYDIPGCVEDGAWMLWENSSVAIAVAVVGHPGLGKGQLSVLLRLRRFRDARIDPSRQASTDGPNTTEVVVGKP